ncbi:MAG: DUF2029 domain-containing protein [Candidatus Pacebacteria bacterium]|nr:DUF2029 domain-containing protein [Candidatus Paceibacterota bacterium]
MTIHDGTFTDRWDRPLKRALAVYVICTVAGFIQGIVAWLFFREPLMAAYFRTDSIIEKYPALISFGSMWLLFGGVLVAARDSRLTRERAVFLTVFSALVLLQLNIFRERIWFGDYRVYVRAAERMLAGQPLPDRYLYPPLWATVLAGVHRLGGRDLSILACFLANQASFILFIPLAVRCLQRLGWSLALSSLLVFAAVCVNVPILRNMGYLQVNVLLVDLVLASILLYPRHRFGSALLLSLGMHLKVFPLAVVPLFLFNRDWRWMIAFVAGGVVIGVLTVLPFGLSYYADFAENLMSWRKVTPRAASLDSFLVMSGGLAGIPKTVSLAVAWVCKAGLTATAFLAGWVAMSRATFARQRGGGGADMVSGVMPLLFLYLLMSPTVWVHHLVVVIPAVLVLALTLRSPATILVFSVAYVMTFVMPTFDMFPWSFLRLAGWLGLYVLTMVVIFRDQRGDWAVRLEARLTRLLQPLTSA